MGVHEKESIFMLLSRVPYPLEKGDKLRAYNQIKEISQHYNITLFAFYEKKLHPDAISEISKYCSKIHTFKICWFTKFIGLFYALFTGLPFQTAYFYSVGAKRAIISLIEDVKPKFAYVQLVRVANYLENCPITKILDLQDALSSNMLRRANREKGLKKMFFKNEYKRILKYEKALLNKYDAFTIISENDKQLIDSPDRNKIEVVPNGVDFEYYTPTQEGKKYTVSFIGNMGYAPNVDAGLFLANEIMPLVWQKKPKAKLVLAGANPDSALVSLSSEYVEVTGWVEDIRPYYSKSLIFVAPLRIGSGMQNKILEAMAMKTPCITTLISAEPIKASHNENILVAETAQEFADNILNLMQSDIERNTLINNAQIFVNQNYNWKSQTSKLIRLMKSLS